MLTTSSRSQSTLVAALAGAALGLTSYSPGAYAASFLGTGSGFSIPDGDLAAISDITFTDNLTITDITVTLLNLRHTFIGDLTATLTNVDSGTIVSLFNRVGSLGGLDFGSDAALNGDYSFNDGFLGDLWDAAFRVETVLPGNYFPTGARSSALASPSLSAFNGQNLAGTWRLTISDGIFGDTGSLGSWQLSGTGTTPEAIPTPALLPGLIGLGLGVCRKRRANGAEADAEV